MNFLQKNKKFNINKKIAYRMIILKISNLNKIFYEEIIIYIVYLIL